MSRPTLPPHLRPPREAARRDPGRHCGDGDAIRRLGRFARCRARLFAGLAEQSGRLLFRVGLGGTVVCSLPVPCLSCHPGIVVLGVVACFYRCDTEVAHRQPYLDRPITLSALNAIFLYVSGYSVIQSTKYLCFNGHDCPMSMSLEMRIVSSSCTYMFMSKCPQVFKKAVLSIII